MNNLLKLTEAKVLPLEAFTLYWFYWANREKELTRLDAAAVLGRSSKNTALKYNKLLEGFGLVKFEIVRARGITGFKAAPQKIDERKLKKILRAGGVILKKKTAKAKESINAKYLPLAELLYEEHKEHDEKFLAGKDIPTTLERWADSIRLLVEKDEREYKLVEKIIRWCQSDGNFWVPNILSGRTLREKFTTLYGQYQRDKGRTRKVSKHKKIKEKKFKGADVKGLLNDL